MNCDWAVVTVVTRNYLHFARMLAASVRQVHPRAEIIVCLVDEPPAGWQRDQEPFKVVFAREMGIKRWQSMSFQYGPYEMAAALKSHVLHFLLTNSKFERVIFLDGDIILQSSIYSILDLLDEADIVLTPQMSMPRSIKKLDSWEADIIDTGVFNSGFLALRKSKSSLDMLLWWQTRVKKRCKKEIMCLDQGWLDPVPALFDRVYIERNPRYNLSPQNLHNRVLTREAGGELLVDSVPLCFFHFVGFNPLQSERLSNCSRRMFSEEPTVIQELYHSYVSELKSHGMAQCQAWGYQYDRLEDGTRIKEEWRELVRTEHPALQNVENPFALRAAEFQRLVRRQKIRKFPARARRAVARVFK